MIETHEIPDGLMLSVEPFHKPNRNAACRIIAEITSSSGKKRSVRFRVCNLTHLLTLSDMTTLMNAMRSLTDEVTRQADIVQERAAKRSRKKG